MTLSREANRGLRAAIVVALACTLSACTPEESTGAGAAVVGLPEGDRLEVVIPRAGRDDTLVFGTFPVCVADAEEVTLDRVDLTSPEGVELVAAGLRVLPDGDGGIATGPGPLPDTFDRLPGARLRLSCDDAQNAELAVELRRTGDAPGTLAGFDLVYRDGNAHTSYPVEITLCPGRASATGCS